MKNLTLIALCVSLVGCATVGTPIKSADVSKIQKGVTTKDEIVKLFGQPYTSFITGDGLTYSYIFTKASTTPSMYIPIVNVIHSEMNTNQQVLTIIFDNKDIVKNYSYTDSNTPIKSGLLP